MVRGCMANLNEWDGINVLHDCLVLNNDCDFNGRDLGGAGIYASGDYNRIEGNHCTRNDSGILVNDWNLIVKNKATGNLVYQYGHAVGAVNNKYGDITDNPETAGPWDNFSYGAKAATAGPLAPEDVGAVEREEGPPYVPEAPIERRRSTRISPEKSD